LLPIGLSACGSAEKVQPAVSVVPDKSDICETWQQLNWSVDDTLITADGIRRNNRRQAAYCKQ
jgi:hypothetical protein